VVKKLNLWSFLLAVVCLLVFLYSFYSSLFLFNVWSAAPPPFIILCLTVLAFIMGLIGFKGIAGKLSVFRSLFTMIISIGLSIILALIVILPFEKQIKTTYSPDRQYAIHFYLTNGGAATSFGVIGDLNGQLWFKKRIYSDYNVDRVDVKWKNNHTVSINGHVLNLKKGQAYRYFKDVNRNARH
jgi:hypothetical protein